MPRRRNNRHRYVYKDSDSPSKQKPGCCPGLREQLCDACRGLWRWFWAEFSELIPQLDREEREDATLQGIPQLMSYEEFPFVIQDERTGAVLPAIQHIPLTTEAIVHDWDCVGMISPPSTENPMPLEQRRGSRAQPPQHPPGVRILNQRTDPLRHHHLKDFVDEYNEAQRRMSLPDYPVSRPLPNIGDLSVSPDDLRRNLNHLRAGLRLPLPRAYHGRRRSREARRQHPHNVLPEVSEMRV